MMSSQRLIKYTSLSFFALFIVNSLTMKFFWFQSIWWFDMPMHFWGGFSSFLLIAYVFYKRFDLHRFSFRGMMTVLLLTILVGLLWEVLEYFLYTVLNGSKFDVIDTLSDVFFDIAGGLFAVLFVRYW
jgi:hypothetical protein